MAAARGLSERRGGRLPPWPEVRRGCREPDERPSATIAGGPRFVRASWSRHWRRGRNGQQGWGRLWASDGEAGERSGFVRRCRKCRIAGTHRGAGREHDGRLWDPRFVRASSVAGRPVWGWLPCCCRCHASVVIGRKQGNGSLTRLIRHRPRPPGIRGHRRLSGFRRGRSGRR